MTVLNATGAMVSSAVMPTMDRCPPMTLTRAKLLAALRGFLLLGLYGFAAFMLLVAPIELYKVHQSRHWPRYDAILTGVRIERGGFDATDSVVYRLIDPVTGNAIATSDLRPGDFPLTVELAGFNVFSTAHDDMRRYAGRSSVTLYRAPDGRHVFLERGDYSLMTLIWLASAALWLWLVLNLKKPGVPANPLRFPLFRHV